MTSEGLLTVIKNNLPILAIVVALITTWVQFGSRLTALETAVIKLEAESSVNRGIFLDIQKQLVEIQTTLKIKLP